MHAPCKATGTQTVNRVRVAITDRLADEAILRIKGREKVRLCLLIPLKLPCPSGVSGLHWLYPRTGNFFLPRKKKAEISWRAQKSEASF